MSHVVIQDGETIAINSICAPHWERAGARIPALREVAGVWMCRSCLRGGEVRPQGRGEVLAGIRSLFAVDPKARPIPVAEVSKALSRSSIRYPAQEEQLSTREKEILQLVAKGYRNDKIAAELPISESTVRGYLTRIYAKVGVSDRVELALFAVHRRLIDP